MAEIKGSGDVKVQLSGVATAGEAAPIMVSASAEAFISKRSAHGPGDEIPETLYHYTSAEGLIEILKTGRIWATSIRYLNDASEFIYASELAKKATAVNYSSTYDWLDRHLVDHARISLDDRGGLTACNVASFSREGNLLSQWRAYCPAGGGFSIGISGQSLNDQAGKTLAVSGKPWRLVPCEYDESTQIGVLQDILSVAHQAYDSAPAREKEVPKSLVELSGVAATALKRPWLQDVTVEFANAMSTIAPVFKDKAFEEEREWRVVSPLELLDIENEKYRAGKFSPIPFVEFELPRKDGLLAVERIFIGPTENPELSAGAVRRMCAHFKVPPPKIELSGVPFRHWDTK